MKFTPKQMQQMLSGLYFELIKEDDLTEIGTCTKSLGNVVMDFRDMLAMIAELYLFEALLFFIFIFLDLFKSGCLHTFGDFFRIAEHGLWLLTHIGWIKPNIAKMHDRIEADYNRIE